MVKGDRHSFLFSSPFYMHGLRIYHKREKNYQLFPFACSILSLRRALLAFWAFTIYTMATKVKGFYNYITSIFVVKEREMEIGCPTDVKHVAHIGWEGPTGNAPSWMKAFKSGPEYAATSMNHSASAISPWSSSQGLGESLTREQTTTNVYKGIASSNVASPPKKHRRRKHPKSTTNSTDSPPSTLRSSRAVKSKVAKSGDQGNPKPPAATIEVS